MLYTINQVPKQRDIILLNFDPQAGTEIKKRRPAVVLSPAEFQQLTGFAVVAPITSTERNFPLHVKVTDCNTHGEILCEQFRSVDFVSRDWEKVDTLPLEQFLLVQQRIAAILDI
ncbi:MAG: hypothetical protein DBY32_09125 [Phascolarctobacterium sp.]|nr:MAG: hypothetical protein DBY32_09125 [Phascolarctobacterium sp.]